MKVYKKDKVLKYKQILLDDVMQIVERKEVKKSSQKFESLEQFVLSYDKFKTE